MTYKCLEKIVRLEYENSQTSGAGCMELEYYLVESEEREDEDLLGERVFGIEIVKKDEQTGIERKLVRNLSCRRENTCEIVHKLAYNAVLPVELPYVLDDLLGG